MPRLPRTVAFWLVAVTTATVLLSSAAPSPLYPVYQQVFGFSAFTLTVVFAVYVIALVGTLLTIGPSPTTSADARSSPRRSSC